MWKSTTGRKFKNLLVETNTEAFVCPAFSETKNPSMSGTLLNLPSVLSDPCDGILIHLVGADKGGGEKSHRGGKRNLTVC